LTGRRDAITTPVNDAMFISGLGHVLSISGYHVVLCVSSIQEASPSTVFMGFLKKARDGIRRECSP